MGAASFSILFTLRATFTVVLHCTAPLGSQLAVACISKPLLLTAP